MQNNSLNIWNPQLYVEDEAEPSKVNSIQIEISASKEPPLETIIRLNGSPLNIQVLREERGVTRTESCCNLSSDEEIPDEAVSVTSPTVPLGPTNQFLKSMSPSLKTLESNKSRPPALNQKSSLSIGGMLRHSVANDSTKEDGLRHRTSAAALPRHFALLPTRQHTLGSVMSLNH